MRMTTKRAKAVKSRAGPVANGVGGYLGLALRRLVRHVHKSDGPYRWWGRSASLYPLGCARAAIILQAVLLFTLLGGPQSASALSVVQEGDQVIVTWEATGVLQTSSDVSGPWSTVEDQTSPVEIPIHETTAKYFRLVQAAQPPQEIPTTPELDFSQEGGGELPEIITESDPEPVVSEEIEGALTDDREAEIRDAILGNEQVIQALGERFAHVYTDVRRAREKGAELGEPLPTRLVLFSHSNNQTVEVLAQGTEVQEVQTTDPSQYQPPEGGREESMAIEIARERLGAQAEGLNGSAILDYPDGVDGEPPQASFHEQRILHVVFTEPDTRQLRFFARVNLTAREVIDWGPRETALPQEIPTTPELDFSQEGGGELPEIITESDPEPVVSEEIEGALTDDREAEIRDAILGNEQVIQALGERFAHVYTDVRRAREKGAELGEPLPTRLVLFSHSNNQTVEVLAQGTEVQEVQTTDPSQYQPPEGGREESMAIEIARERLGAQAEGLNGSAILDYPDGVDGEPPQASFHEQRILHVVFTEPDTRQLRFFARVNLTAREVVASGSAEPNGRSLTGKWNTSFGELRLYQFGVSGLQQDYVIGDYADVGVILARFNGDYLVGVFTNEERTGTLRLEMTGSDSFEGTWAWHGEELGGSWTGERTSSSVLQLDNFTRDGSTIEITENDQTLYDGTYESEFGRLHLLARDGFLIGDYADKGIIAGMWDGDSFIGHFTNGDRTGWLDFAFSPDDGSFESASWGWADEDTVRDWALEPKQELATFPDNMLSDVAFPSE